MKLITVSVVFNLASALALAGACSSPAPQPVVSSPREGGPGSTAPEPATLGVRPRACGITATPVGGCPRDQCGVELQGLHVVGYVAPAGSPGDELDITGGELVLRDGARVHAGRLLVGGKLIFRGESGQERVVAIADYQRVQESDAAGGRRVHHRYFLREKEAAEWFEFACQGQREQDGLAPTTPET